MCKLFKVFNYKEEFNKTIVFFPFLGGNVYAYNNIMNRLKNEYNLIAANPPGHLGSDLELETDINTLINMYYRELKDIIKGDYFFFGHSMGGVIEYFLTKKILDEAEIDAPKHLFISASAAPYKFREYSFLNYDNEKFLEGMINYGIDMKEILKSGVYVDMFAEILRMDYKILKDCMDLERNCMVIDTTLLYAEDDSIVSFEETLSWSKYIKFFDLVCIKNGSHMYLESNIEIIIKYVISVLDKY